MKGIIEMFNPKRQFGFILSGDRTYFFHRDNCAKVFDPKLGAAVEFTVAPPYVLGKRDQAVDVKNIGEESGADGGK